MADFDKLIKFKATMDTSALSQQVRDIENKFKALNQNQGILKQAKEAFGEGSSVSQSAQRVMQQQRKRDIEDMNKKLEEQLKVLERIKEVRADMERKGTLTDAKARKLDEIEASKIGQATAYKQGLQQMQKQPEQIDPETGLPAAEARRLKSSKMWKTISQVLGIAAGAAAVGGSLMQHRQERDRVMQENLGRQTQAANIRFQDTMRGQGFMNYYEQEERRTAMKMALEERNTRVNVTDPLKMIGAVGGSAVTGATGGGLFGGLPGAVIGALGGVGATVFGNRGIFNQLFDRESYNASVNADTFENFQKNLMSQRMQDPGKFAAVKQFGQRQQQFQNLQRSLGLSDEELMGGQIVSKDRSIVNDYQRRATPGQKGQVMRTAQYDGQFGPGTEEGMAYMVESDEDFQGRLQQKREANRAAGEANRNRQKGFLQQNMEDRAGRSAFSEERIMQNINAILGAGGSTDFVRNNRGAGIAAEFQRAGFTNAAAQLGTISGFGGEGADKTEQQFIRMLSEGTRIGFNSSKVTEEQRRFNQALTDIFKTTGGSEGAMRVFGQGMVGTDMGSLQAAKDMFSMINQESGQSTGYRGALKQSFLQSEKGQKYFGGMSENLRQTLTEMDVNSLDVDNPFIQQAAKQMGVDAETMIGRVREMQRFGENLSGETDTKRDALQKAFKTFRGDKKDTADLRQEFLRGKGQEAMVDYLSSFGMEREGIGRLNREQQESLAGFAMSGDMKGLKKKMSEMDLTPTGRAADKAEESGSKDQSAQLQLVNQNLDKLKESFDKNSAEQVEKLLQVVTNTAILEEIKRLGEAGSKEAAGESLLRMFGIGGGSSGNQPESGR